MTVVRTAHRTDGRPHPCDERAGGEGLAADGGFVATEWAVGVAVLVLPVMVLVAILPTWAARHEAASAAAREAARMAVMAGDDPAAGVHAESAAHAVLADRGIDGGRVVVAVHMPPRLPDGSLPRDAAVRVRVTIPGEAVSLPGFGMVAGPAASGAHQRSLDHHRGR